MRGVIRAATVTLLGLAVLVAPSLADARWGRIVYQGEMLPGQRGLFVMDADGARAVMLPPSAALTEMITPALSPFGNRIAFAAHAPDQPFKIYTWDLTLDNRPIGDPQPVTFGDAHDEQPAWSPDASHLAYIRSRGGEHWLMIVNLDSREERRLAPLTSNFRDAHPQWSPSGQRLLFSNEGSLWEVDLAGDVQFLRSGVYGAAYAPDGERIAFFERQGATARLLTMPRAGGAVTPLVEEIAGPGQVSWAPDGQRVIFKASAVSNQPGNLWIVNADGSEFHAAQAMGVAHGYVQWAAHPEVFRPAEEQAPQVTPDAPVRIVNPSPGSTVRGTVPVRVATLDPSGYVSIHLDDEFVFATAEPYTWDWDTSRVSDGRHTLTVDAFDGSRRHVGRSVMVLEIQNRILSGVPDEVLLRLDFRRGEQALYHISGLGIVPRDHPQSTERNRVVGAWMRGTLFTQVNRVAANYAWARIDNRYDDGWWRFGNITRLLQGSRVVQTETTPTGPVRQPGGGLPRTTAVPMAWPSIEFPEAPVAPGDEWEGKLTVTPLFHAARPLELDGLHRVTGFVHFKGHDTIEIISTYDLPPTVIDISGTVETPVIQTAPPSDTGGQQPPGSTMSPSPQAPTGIGWGPSNAAAGGPSPARFSAGSPTGAAAPPPRPATISAGGGGGASQQTSAGQAGAATTTQTQVTSPVLTQVTRVVLQGKGERRTYFAWKTGKIIAIEETITGTLRTGDAPAPVASGGGTQGSSSPPGGTLTPGVQFPTGLGWGGANALTGGPFPGRISAGGPAGAAAGPPRPATISAGGRSGQAQTQTQSQTTTATARATGASGTSFETPYVVSYIIERVSQ